MCACRIGQFCKYNNFHSGGEPYEFCSLRCRAVGARGAFLRYFLPSAERQLLYLEGQDPDKDISLYINSPGGSISAGMAIHDTIQYIKCDVSTICMGMAASMGAFLLASGTKGKRFALPNAEIMIHQPLIAGGLSGQATDIKIHADHIIRTRAKMNRLLSEYTGQPLEKVEQDTERDNFLSAQEAKEYGLIDEVITHR